MTQPVANTPAYHFPTAADQEGSPAMDYEVSRSQFRLWESDDGFSFMDLLDVVNPLQHIPIISSIYRAVTDDAIGIAPRLAGGFLYSGPLGLVFAGASAVFEEATGGDVADNIATLIEEFEEGAPPPTQIVTAADIEGTGYYEGETGSPSDLIASAEPAAGPAAVPVAATAESNSITAAASIPTIPQSADARIRQRIEEAQRAQASLLLASLQAGEARFARPDAGRADRKDDPAQASTAQNAAAESAAQDAATHANRAPNGANPAWFATAMERALAKYQKSQALTQSGAGQ